jgi:hypothetical protein
LIYWLFSETKNGPETLRQQRPALTTTRKDRAMADPNYSDEVWKPIPFAPDYAVSTHGRVKRILPSTSPKARFPNYVSVGLTIDGRSKNYNVHRIVALVFMGSPPTPKHQVAHRDGDGFNNSLDNLRWATQVENERDKLAHGTRYRGEMSVGSKLTERDVLEIRKAIGPQSKLAAKYGVAQTTISKIKRRVRWAHI